MATPMGRFRSQHQHESAEPGGSGSEQEEYPVLQHAEYEREDDET